MSGASGLRKHGHSSAGDGGTLGALTPSSLVVPGASSPSQTTEGEAKWDTDDDKLTVGTGSGRKTMVNEGAVTSSGLTQATGKLLGRSTASTGAIEEIAVGSNLTLAGGTLSASGGGGGGFDPTTQALVYDDCLAYALDTTDLFAGMVRLEASGTDAGLLNLATGDYLNHPGIVNPATGTDTAAYAALRGGGYYITQIKSLTFGAVAALGPLLSSGTHRYIVRMGLGTDIRNDDTGKGIYFRYSDNLNSGKWQGVVVDQSFVEQTLDTGVTAATSTWKRFGFVVNSGATACEFFIDGSSVGTITATMPSPNTQMLLTPVTIQKTVGSANRYMFLDAYWYSWTVTR